MSIFYGLATRRLYFLKHRKNCETALFKVWIVEKVFFVGSKEGQGQGSFYENTVQKSVCSVLSVVCIVYSEQVGLYSLLI